MIGNSDQAIDLSRLNIGAGPVDRNGSKSNPRCGRRQLGQARALSGFRRGPGPHHRAELKPLEGPLLPILHALSGRVRLRGRARHPLIAEALNLSRAEVHGVVTFYHDFRARACRPPRAEALPRRGLPVDGRRRDRWRTLRAAARHPLRRDRRRRHGHARAGLLPRASAPCAPSAMLDGEVIGRLDADSSTPRRRRCAHDASQSSSRGDAGALAVGADEVAAAIARDVAAARHRRQDRAQRLARPVLAGAAGRGRDAGGPRRLWAGRARATCAALFDAGFLDGGSAPAVASASPRTSRFCKRQTRLTFARCGIIDPLSLEDYRAHGGLTGPERAPCAWRRPTIVEEVTESGPARPRRRRLPDRHQVEDRARHPGRPQKYIVCNADEGDSGTFADRMIMEGDPFVLIEGMAIAGIATGATKGYIYIRSEYPHAIADHGRGHRDRPQAPACSAQRARLGRRLRHGSPRRRRRLCLRRGDLAARTAWKASAAWCAPSRRCRRIKGLFGKPTVINNVISLASVPVIMAKGAAFYRTSAWAARAAPCRSSSPATSSMAACSRRPSA